jgi:hypothetical protein
LLASPLRICFSEENDGDFIRWTSNLLRTFLQERSVVFVRQNESPQLMIASIWRKHAFPEGLPVVLLTNENWKLFRAHAPLHKYLAVIAIYPPSKSCPVIEYPYAAVQFDVPVDELYALRQELLKEPKTHFCCFVASNTAGELGARRVALFKEIDSWKRVDSAGRVLNNVDYLAPRGLEFLRWISRYRFMISLENSKDSRYVTEKPFQPWFAGTVPIYDGGCVNQLNQDAIVNASSAQVLSQLEVLEAQPALYDAKRLANLTSHPISLTAFEEQFRRLMTDLSDTRALEPTRPFH